MEFGPNNVRSMCKKSYMRKDVDARTLFGETFKDCLNFKLAAFYFSLIFFIKINYYGMFINIKQIVHSNAHLDPLKGTN